MSLVDAPPVSIETYDAFPKDEWQKWELSAGKLVSRYGDDPGGRPYRSLLRGELLAALFVYLRGEKRGLAISGQDFKLAPNTVRRPDISFILTERLNLVADDPTIVMEPPDLAIEFVSPKNRRNDIDQKIQQLLEAGCGQVWLLSADPELFSTLEELEQFPVRPKADDIVAPDEILAAPVNASAKLVYASLAVVCTSGGRCELGLDDTLEAPAMLPGFRVELRELFKSASL